MSREHRSGLYYFTHPTPHSFHHPPQPPAPAGSCSQPNCHGRSRSHPIQTGCSALSSSRRPSRPVPPEPSCPHFPSKPLQVPCLLQTRIVPATPGPPVYFSGCTATLPSLRPESLFPPLSEPLQTVAARPGAAPPRSPRTPNGSPPAESPLPRSAAQRGSHASVPAALGWPVPRELAPPLSRSAPGRPGLIGREPPSLELLPALSVRGHRHLVQRVPRGDLEAPLRPGAHCGDAEGARAREEERRCRTELRQEQETYGRAGAATAARGHRSVPSGGLAATTRAEPLGPPRTQQARAHSCVQRRQRGQPQEREAACLTKCPASSTLGTSCPCTRRARSMASSAPWGKQDVL